MIVQTIRVQNIVQRCVLQRVNKTVRFIVKIPVKTVAKRRVNHCVQIIVAIIRVENTHVLIFALIHVNRGVIRHVIIRVLVLINVHKIVKIRVFKRVVKINVVLNVKRPHVVHRVLVHVILIVLTK